MHLFENSPEGVLPVADIKIVDPESAKVLIDVISVDRDLIFELFVFAEDERIRDIIRGQDPDTLQKMWENNTNSYFSAF